MKLTRKVVQIEDFDGNTIELKKLSVEAADEALKAFAENKGDGMKMFHAEKKVLLDAGMPENILNQLDLEDFNLILAEVMGTRKK